MKVKSLFVLPALVFLFLFLGSVIGQEEKDENKEYYLKAKVLQEPLLREKIVPGGPARTYLLNGLIDQHSDYDVWIENSEVCRFMGKINQGDIKIIFVPLSKTIKLPPTEKIVYEKIVKKKEGESAPKFYSTTPIYKKDLLGGGFEIIIVDPTNGRTEIFRSELKKNSATVK